MAEQRIHRSVRFGAESFGPGQEKELAKRLSAKDAARLEEAGAVSGFGSSRAAKAEKDYAAMTKAELEKEAKKQGVEVQGTGSGGAVLKDDLVAALETM